MSELLSKDPVSTESLITPQLLAALVPRLRCPQSGNGLAEATAEQLVTLNARIAGAEVWTLTGTLWQAPLQHALIDSSQQFAYPIADGLFFFLPDYTLQLEGKPDAAEADELAKQSQGVRGFYDQIGWEEKEGGFEDAHLFEDLRPVAQEYLRKCHLRINDYLPNEGGAFILDAASGPVQYDEFLSYHENFDWRICLDFSISALKQAQQRVGARSVYMLADLTNLPFQEGSLDAIISLHTVYHIPKEKQRTAFLEIHRALMPGKQGLVVYGWGSHHRMYKIAFFHKRVLHKLKRMFGQLPKPQPASGGADAPPVLYVHFHTWEWFQQQQWPFKLELFQWRALGPGVTKLWVKPWFFGKQILRWMFRQENKAPQKWAIWGAFPTFVIRKPKV